MAEFRRAGNHRWVFGTALLLLLVVLGGCKGTPKYNPPPKSVATPDYNYIVGPLDSVNIIVWRNPELSMSVPVRHEDFFRNMKPGSFFINTARAKIMDGRALYDALKSEHLAAARVDVWPTEPPPDSDPLIKAWKAGEPWIRHRFTLTPHSAFFCRAPWEELRTKGALEVKRVLQGEKPRGCVNQEWLVNPRYRRQS